MGAIEPSGSLVHDGRMVRGAICLAVMFAAGCDRRPDAPVTEAAARETAAAMFDDYVTDLGLDREAFSAATIEEHPDGWSFKYACKAAPKSRMGIFVERDGIADYDLAPDHECGRAAPKR